MRRNSLGDVSNFEVGPGVLQKIDDQYESGLKPKEVSDERKEIKPENLAVIDNASPIRSVELNKVD